MVPLERFTTVFQEKVIRFLFKCQIISSVIVNTFLYVEANLWKEVPVSSPICFNSPLRWYSGVGVSVCVCVRACLRKITRVLSVCFFCVCVFVCVCVCVGVLPLCITPSLPLTLCDFEADERTATHIFTQPAAHCYLQPTTNAELN